MTTKYYALLTEIGAAKLANATALGTKLQITQMAVGDGGGTLPTPGAKQTALIGEKRRASLNSLSVDPVNGSQIIAEQIIPESEGGYWIREIGLFDADNVLIAVANCAETYKPQLQEGSGRTQTVRMILIVSSTEAVTLKIDPSVVLATRKYVDDKVIEVKAYVDSHFAEHLAAANPHGQYLSAANALMEIKKKNLVSQALLNLGLGEGSALPVGVPIPWPSATPPTGWLKCNGAAFTASQYPKLALAYPALRLPDLRGEFIRGWDDGRGVDAGRVLLVAQAETKISNYHGNGSSPDEVSTGVQGSPPKNFGFNVDSKEIISSGFTAYGSQELNMTGITTRFGVRPRNVAFSYIVRAA